MTRTTRLAAITAAALFVAAASIDIPRDQPLVFTGAIDYLLEGLFAAALWAAAAALVALAIGNPRLPARIVLGTAALGHSLFAVAATATLVNGRESLDPVSSVGLLLILVGYLGFLIVDLLKRVTPRFTGIAMFVATIGMFALGDGWGMIAWAAGWFAVAAIVHERQPERVLA